MVDSLVQSNLFITHSKSSYFEYTSASKNNYEELCKLATNNPLQILKIINTRCLKESNNIAKQITNKKKHTMYMAYSNKPDQRQIKNKPFYDKNDPDIIFLHNYMSRNSINRKSEEHIKDTTCDILEERHSAKAPAIVQEQLSNYTFYESRPITGNPGRRELISDTYKMVKGGGFAIVGKSTKICSRMNKGAISKKNTNSCMVIDSRLNRVKSRGTRLGNSQTRNSNKLISSLNDNMGSLHERSRRSIQQINLITDPSYVYEAMKMEDINYKGQGDESNKKDCVVKNEVKYAAMGHIRPYTNYRRPISAAVNIKVDKKRSRTINPQHTRVKYMKYLKVLEHTLHKG